MMSGQFGEGGAAELPLARLQIEVKLKKQLETQFPLQSGALLPVLSSTRSCKSV